jgi:UDP-3-O-[3-hydroxymyristoyl] glucosamine N-acyltransferase
MPVLTLAQLAEITGARPFGDLDCEIQGVASLEDAQAGQLSFLNNAKFSQYLPTTQASVVILQETARATCPCHTLVCDDPYLAYARAANALAAEDASLSGVHESAVVASTAQIAADAYIAANCSIGEGVKIAGGVSVGPNCVVMDGCVIGENTRLIANVILCAETWIGKNCILHAGVVLGSDGFGLANDQGRWVKVPQLGKVILEDHVEIGANSTVDRGALHDTVLAEGVKLDNLVHVGHNVQIGQHTAIAGCVGIAGSSKIGSYCMIAGAVAINGHIEITDHVHISGMTAVTRPLLEPGRYTGTVPAIPHAQWRKNFVYLRKLHSVIQRLKGVEKRLGIFQHSSRK